MSAWMVTDAHVDLLATAYLALVDTAADPQAIGQQMLRDNARPIRARYGHDPDYCRAAELQAEAYRYRRWLGNMRPELVSKQIACLDYQCSEFDGWAASASRRRIEALQWHCPKFEAIADRPEVEAMPWGIDEHELPEPAGSGSKDDQRPVTPRDRQLIALTLASPNRAPAGRLVSDQHDAAHLPLFIAANEPRLI